MTAARAGQMTAGFWVNCNRAMGAGEALTWVALDFSRLIKQNISSHRSTGLAARSNTTILPGQSRSEQRVMCFWSRRLFWRSEGLLNEASVAFGVSAFTVRVAVLLAAAPF